MGDDEDFIRLVKGFVDDKMKEMILQVEASREYMKDRPLDCFADFEKCRLEK